MPVWTREAAHPIQPGISAGAGVTTRPGNGARTPIARAGSSLAASQSNDLIDIPERLRPMSDENDGSAPA
jgi:hypothetical protein